MEINPTDKEKNMAELVIINDGFFEEEEEIDFEDESDSFYNIGGSK